MACIMYLEVTFKIGQQCRKTIYQTLKTLVDKTNQSKLLKMQFLDGNSITTLTVLQYILKKTINLGFHNGQAAIEHHVGLIQL